MSWVARCPKCGTTYKVVSDQLKIAQGWLRCGQCQHAFDSTGLIVAWPEAVHGLPGEIVAEVAVERLIVDELLKQEDRSSDVQTVSAVASFEDALSTFKPLSPLPLERGADQTDTSQPQRSKSGSWASKWFAAVLLFTLAFQWLWMERQTLVEKNPHVAKILHVVCRVLACEILPLQVRDGVVIENSSLMPQGDGFLLSWSVRNATSHQLQMPALELTLLNAQDKTLVRRVFSVSELEAPAALAQGEILEGKLQVMPEAGLSPSGYRLLSFYP
ncbi:hypothetical protein B9Z45_04440 [Limnohabitans sp. 2KL-17]|nr:hypothetical protein B9Z45_04440 [Limnohabitans sp. 2KL-17]